ncbi:MAG: carboxypeptidase-like regulatory domain-containing protein, partial [Ignavibacteriales bacterium]|nr:carboxypeptidase-like regulatory domain-containing protein [Ignavibacteriales bacterium]
MIKVSFFLFLLLVCQNIFPQTKISGKVIDENNSPLIGANVYIQDTYDGTSTEADGSFDFWIDEKGKVALIVSYIGYVTYQKEIISEGKEIQLEIVMEQDTKELGTVIISAGYFEASDEKKSIILRPLDILTTGSDADIYSTLETLPGTQQIGETEGLFVRGGSASETKTIIDEMIVQNPYYSSVPDVAARGRFSPMLFQGTMFSTGGYSAQYGQALSSVLILKTQDLPEETSTAI